jgi:hypothetical protein
VPLLLLSGQQTTEVTDLWCSMLRQYQAQHPGDGLEEVRALGSCTAAGSASAHGALPRLTDAALLLLTGVQVAPVSSCAAPAA